MRTSVKTTTAGIGLVAAAAIGVALLGATAGRQTVTAVPELVAATDSVDAKTRAEIVRIAERAVVRRPRRRQREVECIERAQELIPRGGRGVERIGRDRSHRIDFGDGGLQRNDGDG